MSQLRAFLSRMLLQIKFVVQISISQGLPSNQLQEFDPLRGRIDHFWRDAFKIVVKTEEINTQQKKLEKLLQKKPKLVILLK